MRKKRIFGMLPLVLGAVLTGCTQNDAWDDAGRSGKQVRLTASSGTQVTVEEGGRTRAADGQYTAATGFAGGEKVMIYMKGTATTSAVYDVGAPDANKKSALSVASGSTELEYPAEGNVTLYGVYPSTSTASHVVKRDQTSTTAGNANYKLSDLMYGKTAAITPAQHSNAQELTFNHQMVKLKVIVNKATDVSQVTSLALNNVLRKVPVTAISESGITLGTAIAPVSGDADYSSDEATNKSILLGKSETASDAEQTYTYTCVFPAQSWATGTVLLTIYADDLSASFAPAATTAFVGGREYTVTLNVDQAVLGVEGVSPLWAGQLSSRDGSFINE